MRRLMLAGMVAALLAGTIGADQAGPVGAAEDKPPLVAIDAGHGGPDYGTSGQANGQRLIEKELTLQVARRTSELLQRAGYRTLLTRSDDVAVHRGRDLNDDGKVDTADDLQARVDRANEAGATILVSIHFNGSTDRSLRGTEVYYSAARPFAAENRKLADAMLAATAARLGEAEKGPKPRGIRRDSILGGHLFLLGPQGGRIARASAMPGVLVEGMFLTNSEDAALLTDAKTVQSLAHGYADGIAAYLGPPPKPRPKRAVVVGTAGAFLRPAPLIGTTPMTTLPPGTTVDLAEAARGDEVGGAAEWWRVDWKGQAGYVFAALLEPRVDAAPAPPAGGGQGKPATPEKAADRPGVAQKPAGAERPAGDAVEKPAGERPTAAKPSAQKAAPEKPAAEKPAEAVGGRRGTVKIDDGRPARVRSEPTLSSEIVLRVPVGETVEVLAEAEGERVDGGSARWLKVRRGETTGWVWAPLID